MLEFGTIPLKAMYKSVVRIHILAPFCKCYCDNVTATRGVLRKTGVEPVAKGSTVVAVVSYHERRGVVNAADGAARHFTHKVSNSSVV